VPVDGGSGDVLDGGNVQDALVVFQRVSNGIQLGRVFKTGQLDMHDRHEVAEKLVHEEITKISILAGGQK
jgi:hypothetical protein